MFVNFLWVAIGGSIGAMLRYAVSLAGIHYFGNGFPWATLIVNISGCLVMGALLGLGVQKNVESAYLLVGVGVLGSLTTFSTFSAETLQMAYEGNWFNSAGNIILNVVCSLLACGLGMTLVRWIYGS